MTETVCRIHEKRGNYALCTMERGGGDVWCVLRDTPWRGRIEGIKFETEDEARKYFRERTAKRCQ